MSAIVWPLFETDQSDSDLRTRRGVCVEAYASEHSISHSMLPSAGARRSARSQPIELLKIAAPLPSRPKVLSFVDEAVRQRYLCERSGLQAHGLEGLPTGSPDVERSTRNAMMPSGPEAGSSFAKTRQTSALHALVTNVFTPLSRYPPSTRVALVWRLNASDPASVQSLRARPINSPRHNAASSQVGC
jgi:hypothetical protein